MTSFQDRRCSASNRYTNSLHDPPDGRMNTDLPAAAVSSLSERSGHQATLTTAAAAPSWLREPSLWVAASLPLRTSHTLRVPSEEPEASHCPVGSGAMLSTCAQPKYSFLSDVDEAAVEGLGMQIPAEVCRELLCSLWAPDHDGSYTRVWTCVGKCISPLCQTHDF